MVLDFCADDKLVRFPNVPVVLPHALGARALASEAFDANAFALVKDFDTIFSSDGVRIITLGWIPNGEENYLILGTPNLLDAEITRVPSTRHEIRAVNRSFDNHFVIEQNAFGRGITQMHRTSGAKLSPRFFFCAWEFFQAQAEQAYAHHAKELGHGEILQRKLLNVSQFFLMTTAFPAFGRTAFMFLRQDDICFHWAVSACRGSNRLASTST